MKNSVLALITCVATIVGCSNKQTVEMPIDGVYPHLLKKEKEFVKEMDNLSKKFDAESEKERVRIKGELFDLIAKDTTTLSHEFGPLLENEEFNIVTSPDKKFRIYVTKCDTEVGASMNLVQYRDSSGTIHTLNAEQYTQQDGNSDAVQLLFEHWSHRIFEFPCKDGTKLYVITFDANLNGELLNHSLTYILSTYKIKGNQLEPEESFVINDKATHYIERIFNDSYFWFYPEEQHYDFVEVDSVNNILYVGNEIDNYPIDRYQCFQFNGTHLTETGESAPFWLHPSFHKYERICYLCTSESHYIRVDDMGQGIYRYASWPRNTRFSDAPSLVIFGKETNIADRGDIYNHALSFVNEGYEYRILLIPGRWGLYADEIEILNNGKVIQKSDLE